MKEDYIYYFKKSRKQRSKLFIRMGIASLIYIVALYLTEAFLNVEVPNDIHLIIVVSFSLVAAILFYIAWWHIKNPATYKAFITKKEFTIHYPNVPTWSFKVRTEDIIKFENRQTYGSGGKSILDIGIVMKNGDFHKISMNYGNNVNKIYKALKKVKPEITFPKGVKANYYLFGNNIGQP